MREKDIAIWEKAREFLDVRTNDEHTVYSYYLAEKLLDFENDADPDVVLPAVILHDTGWKKIPADKVLHAFGPKMKYPELQRQHELESVEIARSILKELGYDEDLVKQITDIIDGHDTVKTARSLNDAVMKDADKLWRYTDHGIRTISAWFEMNKQEFLDVLENFVKPKLLRDSGRLLAESMLTVARLQDSVQDYIIPQNQTPA